MTSSLWERLKQRPGRLGTLAGWYQQAGGLAVLLLVIPVVTRLLSPVESGIWFSFLSLAALINYVDFGFSFVLSRQVAHTLGRAEGAAPVAGTDFLPVPPGREGVIDLRRAARRIYGVIALIALALLVLSYEVFFPHGKILAAPIPHLRLCWYLLGLSALMALLCTQYQAFYNGMGSVYLSRLLGGTYQIVLNGAILIPLWFGGGVLGMAAMALVASLAYLSISRLMLARVAPWLHGRGTPSPGLIRGVIRTAGPIGFVNVGGALVSYSQVPLLALFLGPSWVTPFYLAQRIGYALTATAQQIVQPQLPYFTAHLGARRFHDARRLLFRILLLSAAVTIVAMAVFFWGSPLLAHYILGRETYVGRETLGLMAIDYTLLGLAVPWAQFILASGRNPFVLSTLLNGGINLALIALLASRLGLPALPLASLMAGFATNYWYIIYRSRKLLGELHEEKSSSPSQEPTPWLLLSDAPPLAEQAAGCQRIAADLIRAGSPSFRGTITRRMARSIPPETIGQNLTGPVFLCPDTASVLPFWIPGTAADLLDVVLLILYLPVLRRRTAATGTCRLLALSGANGWFLIRARLTAWSLNLPLDIYLVDDIETWTRLHKSKPLAWMMSKIEPWALGGAQRVFTISPGYVSHLEAKYGIHAEWLPLPVPLSPGIPEASGQRNTLVYLGSLNVLYDEALITLYEAIAAHRRRNPSANLNLLLLTYSDPTALLAQFSGTEGVKVLLRADDAVRAREMRESLACVLPYAFVPEVRKMVQTSFPSKLADYFFSGRPILSYGPSDSSVAVYFREAGLPFNTHSRGDLDAALDILADPSRLDSTALANEYFECWKKFHSPDAIRRNLGYDANHG